MRSWCSSLVLLLIGTLLALLPGAPSAQAHGDDGDPILPARFADEIAIAHLDEPTALAFAPSGQVFVALKSGIILAYDGLDDTTPTTFADLSVDTLNMWDRGLLGLAVSPHFPTDPSIYALYAYNHVPGSSALPPAYGTGDSYDQCDAAEAGGCVSDARLVRLTAGGADFEHMVGDQQVLVDDYCYQFPSHGSGTLMFGPDGYLYASSGEGASYDDVDYGQFDNPCQDPARQGGSLRAQDLRTSGDPTTLDGAIIRIDPATGQAASINPLAGSSDPNARMILAEGMRNPFRFTIQPGTGDVYVGDVGNDSYEEIDRLPAASSAVTNFGWPCYEGKGRNSGFGVLDLPICQGLYADQDAITTPLFQYATRGGELTEGEQCRAGSSSISGLAFAPDAATWPKAYRGALLFADYSRGCIWSMRTGANGRPDPSTLAPFVQNASSPVQLTIGPDGALYYVDLGIDPLGYPAPNAGSIHRVAYYPGNRPPHAELTASATSGALPLTVAFDASGSTDADGDTLGYSWDLDGDGTFGDAFGPKITRTYDQPANATVAVRVTDGNGSSAVESTTVYPGDTPPSLSIASPSSGLRWSAGQTIELSGSATDAEDGALDDSHLLWTLSVHHCPSSCHTHPIDRWPGQGTAYFSAPDHEYPSTLLLTFSATDSRGLTTTRQFELQPLPQTVKVTTALRTGKRLTPIKGLRLGLAGDTVRTPSTRTFITGNSTTLVAPATQKVGGRTYAFVGWSDGQARVHTVTVPSRSITYTAIYRRRS